MGCHTWAHLHRAKISHKKLRQNRAVSKIYKKLRKQGNDSLAVMVLIFNNLISFKEHHFDEWEKIEWLYFHIYPCGKYIYWEHREENNVRDWLFRVNGYPEFEIRSAKDIKKLMLWRKQGYEVYLASESEKGIGSLLSFDSKDPNWKILKKRLKRYFKENPEHTLYFG